MAHRIIMAARIKRTLAPGPHTVLLRWKTSPGVKAAVTSTKPVIVLTDHKR